MESAAYAGARVLVTGGIGFIGSHLAHRLADSGAEVTLVDSLIPEYGGNLANLGGFAERVRVNIADVRDAHGMRYLIRDQDFLFNLAGQTSHLDSMTDPVTDLDINCRAQLMILEACRQSNPGVKIVFASTRQLYGRPDYLPVDERHPARPVDVNGINKLAGEWYHLLYDQVYGIRSTALRLTNTYGPGMRIKDGRQTFLGVWVRRVLEGQPFEVWGGPQRRDFTYVDDAVDAFLRAGASDTANGQVFNVGGLEVVSLEELAKMVTEIAGGSYTVMQFPDDRKRIDIGDYYADDTRIREALGWKPTIDLRAGLSRTFAYFAEQLASYV